MLSSDIDNFFLRMFHYVFGQNGERAPRLVREQAETEEGSTLHKRLLEVDVSTLIEEFHQWRNGNIANKSYKTSKRRMEIFLEFLASGSFYRKTAKAEGVSRSATILATRSAVSFFMDNARNFIFLPQHHEFRRLAQNVTDINGQNWQIILFVDGVIVPIQRPDGAGDGFYCGRNGKNRDSLNVQVIKKIVPSENNY